LTHKTLLSYTSNPRCLSVLDTSTQFVSNNDMYISGHNTDTLEHKTQSTPIIDMNMFQAITTSSGL